MRLLLDENLSPRLLDLLRVSFPDTVHVSSVGLARASDTEIWEYAQAHGLIIVSRDSDFHQRSLVALNPPKVVWIRRGDCSTQSIAEILLAHRSSILLLSSQDVETLLVLD